MSASVGAPTVLGQAICAAAKLELGQEAALEREGFTARLSMTNNLGDLPLSDLRVEVIILDSDGLPASHLFFVGVTNLEGVAAVDGTGVVQPAGTAKASWLIVPSPGAGGTAAAGIRYTAQARMTFNTGGVPRIVTTFPVAITVKPQPLLKLEYVLPFEVFGDEPFTPVVESTVPFPLGLRVSNIGAGTAKRFTVESGQPKITDNAQGLAVDFSLLGTWLGSAALPDNTFLINFGDIAPGGASQAAWSMTSSLSGRFTEFTSTFTHAAELGGALTSLIQSVTTYTLVKDVLVDLPGRDAQFDFLINVTTPRSQLEDEFELGREPKPEYLMESDRPGLTPVLDVAGQLSGTPSGTGSVLNYQFLTAVPTGTWVHSSIPLPTGASAPLVSVTRADGKVVSPRNAWVSRHFDKDTLSYSYFLHVLDYTGEEPAAYAMAFDASALDVAPAAITDLQAAPAGHGALALTWTATGEDGTEGAIFGGSYKVFASTDPAAVPSAAAAQLTFTTSTNAGAAQSHRLSGLIGNATYHVAVFIGDGGGSYSTASNTATARSGAHGPQGLAGAAGETALALAWSNAANLPGAAYRLTLSTGAGSVADSGYVVDASSYEFTGLLADTSYYLTAQASNADGFESSATAAGTFVTLAAAPTVAADSFLFVSSDTVLVQWAGAPGRYRVRASTGPGGAELFAEVTGATAAAVGGLTPDAGYDFAVAALNGAGEAGAYVGLGSTVTLGALLPPVLSTATFTSITVSWTSGAASGFRVEASTVEFGAGGELLVAASTQVAVSSLSVTGLVPGSSYYVRALALNRDGAAAVYDFGVLATPSLFLAESVDGIARLLTPIAGSSITVVSSAPATGPLAAAMAQRLTPVTAFYELSPSPVVFDPPAALSMLFDPAGVDTGTVSLYRFSGVAWDSAPVTAQKLLVLASTQARVSGTLLGASLYGAFSASSLSAPNLASIAPSLGADTGPVSVTAQGSDLQDGGTLELRRVNSASGTWTVSGAFNVARWHHGAARLADGRVLAAGGSGNSSSDIKSSAELYDPGTGAWTLTASMSTPRHWHQVVALPNGRALAMGGRSADSSGWQNSAELYDPAAGSWTPTGSMASARAEFVAVVLLDGKVLVAGGSAGLGVLVASAELYDPATGSWAPAGSLSAGRVRPRGTLLADGRVLVTGGVGSSGISAAADLYDPATGTWSTVAPMGTARQRHVLAALPDGRALAAGGDTGGASATAELFDPATGSWSSAPAMGAARSEASATRLHDGTVLVAGGNGASFQLLSSAETFDSIAGAWVPAPAMPTGRTEHAATLLGSGELLLSGGVDTTGLAAASTLFTPASFSIVASSVVVAGSNEASGTLDLTGRPTGAWDVRWTNPDGAEAVLPGGFTIFHAAPPAATADLAFAAVHDSSVTLRWTAPASFNGLAAYELRRATFPLTEATFVAGQLVAAPAPAAAGTLQTVDVTDVLEDTFYAALRSSDVFGSLSPLSNVAGLARSATVVDGSREASFHAGQPVFLSPASSAAVAGAAYAAGLTRLSGLYAPSPAGSYSPEAALNFRYAQADLDASLISPATLRLYASTGGPLVAVSSQSVDLGARRVSAPIAELPAGASFGLFGLAPAPVVSAIAPDSAPGSGAVSVTVDGSEFRSGASLHLRRVDASSSPFTATGAMLTPRHRHTATRLPGGKVLVAGGSGNVSTEIFASAELFDPQTRTWSVTGAMGTMRQLHSAVALPSGRVLVMGGRSGDSSGWQSTAEVYDPISGTWTPTGSMTTPRAEFVGVVLSNGKVLAVGGSAGLGVLVASAELYDPATGSWTPAGSLSAGRVRPQGTVLADGRVLVTGGVGNSGISSLADLYDPATGTWSTVAPMGTPRQRHVLAALPDGRALAAGGDTGAIAASTELYDPVTNAWSPAAPMAAARQDATALRLTDGRVLVAAGLNGEEVAEVELYDPASGAWSTAGLLSPARFENTATLLADGAVLLAGGFNETGVIAPAAVFRLPALDIVATGVSVAGPAQLSGSLDLAGQPLGAWDVVVTNADGRSGTLSAGFTITTATYVAASGDAVATLSSSRAEETVTVVSTSAAPAAYAVASGQGLVLVTPAFYELSPSPVVFDPPARLSFLFDPTDVDTATVAIYRYEGTQWSSAPVGGLTLELLQPDLARISGYLAGASLYAVFAPAPAQAPALTAITVSPSTAAVSIGGSQAYTAVGTFSDGSTRAFASTAGAWQAKAGLGVPRADAAGAYVDGKL
ncbi:MAG: kelch repeat-containing protein, partial [Armatimonadota bacterium]